MSGELDRIPQGPMDNSPSLFQTFDDLERISEKFATSSIKALAGRPGDAFIYAIICRDTGMNIVEATNNFYVADGKVAAYGQYMLSQVLGAGHKVRFKEEGAPRADDYRMTCTIIRKDDPEDEFSVTWSVKRAKEAGLYDPGKKTSAWYKSLPNMLRWRAFTEAARFKVPDSMGFAKHTPEELGAEVNEDGVPIITSAPAPTAPTVTVTRADKPATPTTSTPVRPTKVTPAASAKVPDKAPIAEPKKPTVIQGTATEKPSAPTSAQDIAAEALRIVKDAVQGNKTSDPEIKKSYRTLKAQAEKSGKLMEKVTIPGDNGADRTLPLRGALNVLEKHLA